MPLDAHIDRSEPVTINKREKRVMQNFAILAAIEPLVYSLADRALIDQGLFYRGFLFIFLWEGFSRLTDNLVEQWYGDEQELNKGDEFQPRETLKMPLYPRIACSGSDAIDKLAPQRLHVLATLAALFYLLPNKTLIYQRLLFVFLWAGFRYSAIKHIARWYEKGQELIKEGAIRLLKQVVGAVVVLCLWLLILIYGYGAKPGKRRNRVGAFSNA